VQRDGDPRHHVVVPKVFVCLVALALALTSVFGVCVASDSPSRGSRTNSSHASGSRTNSSIAVAPLFDLSAPERAPFPSNYFTVADAAQNTGRRVNLPMPRDCVAEASECEDRAVLNQFDGFNMQPRISVPFSGWIDPASVTSDTVFLFRIGSPAASRIALNQIVWDPETHELSAHPDNTLEQHTTYALVVTTGVRDANGNAIVTPPAFRRYRDEKVSKDGDDYYRRALQDADRAVARFRGPQDHFVVAVMSVFTTQSFSHIVERLHEAIRRAPAPSLDFAVGPDHARAVFDAAQLQAITNHSQTQTAANAPPTDQPMNLTAMRVVPDAVGTVAFGTFRTLDFTVRPSSHIPPIPTRTGKLEPTGTLDVAFNIWLPAGTPPPNGWPVVIYGHGSNGSKNAPFVHASVLTSHHLAVIAINGAGCGGGPDTTMTATLRDGRTMTFAAPGLGYDADGDGTIGTWEPSRAKRPMMLLNTSGSIAQSISLFFALVRGIQAGVDVNGDGKADLDASRIYYLGQSMGANWGVMTFAYEPAIRAAVFNVVGGTLIYNTARSPLIRPGLAELLAARTPSLINGENDHVENGVKMLDGIAVAPPHFNENLPLRNQPPVSNTIAGAMAIQRVMDGIAWGAQMTSSVAAAPLLRKSPVAGVPARPFLIQMARSDQMSNNPSTSELIRAGDIADRVVLYRHDRNAGAGNPGVIPNPHPFLGQVVAPSESMRTVAVAAQHQIGAFFESDGTKVIAPSPGELWEFPIVGPPPEDLYFLPRRQSQSQPQLQPKP
jgi:hypothetical protein